MALPSTPRIIDAHHHTHLLRGGRGAENLNLDPRVCMESILPIEPSLQALIMALLYIHVLVSYFFSSPTFSSWLLCQRSPSFPSSLPSSCFCFHSRAPFLTLSSSLPLTSRKISSSPLMLLYFTELHKHT